MKSDTAGHQEIERKFLVPQPPADLHRHPAETVEQGYLARDAERGVEVRLRRIGGGRRCVLTVKVGAGQRRDEVELPLETGAFDALWPATAGRRIRKERHRLPLATGGEEAELTVEVDVYADALAGLCVAEVEFPDEAAARAFRPPAWFGREVTDDPAYRNAALARHGRPASALTPQESRPQAKADKADKADEAANANADATEAAKADDADGADNADDANGIADDADADDASGERAGDAAR